MTARSSPLLFLLVGVVFAGTAVAAGAFGAHALRGTLDTHMLEVFDTAVRYQMYHALGLGILSCVSMRHPDHGLQIVGWLFTGGVLLFCGSLYGVALAGMRWLGAVTPLGGVAFIAGWGLFAWRISRVMACEDATG
jgi:uncharacterized membrane protein YgdD (TMEM256/DUF423 family)